MKPLNPVLFPNSGSSLVKALKDETPKWATMFPVLAKVRIATKREDLPIGGPYSTQAIITPTASKYMFNGSKKLQGYNINLFGNSYEDVEKLGTALEVVFQTIQTVPFHWLQVNMSAIPVDGSLYEKENHRFMSVDGLIIGTFVGL
jgi:hypothetical protein